MPAPSWGNPELPGTLNWEFGADPVMGSACSASPRFVRPVRSSASAPIAMSGALSLKGSRRMREPVTTISSISATGWVQPPPTGATAAIRGNAPAIAQRLRIIDIADRSGVSSLVLRARARRDHGLLVPKLAPEDLAHVGLRQVVPEYHFPGDLVSRQVLAAMGDEFIGRQCRIPPDHEQPDRFAGLLVGNADRSGFQYVRVRGCGHLRSRSDRR